MKMINRKLVKSLLTKPVIFPTVLKTPIRCFNYDHWYMEDAERQRRIEEKRRQLLKEFKLDEIPKYSWRYFKRNMKMFGQEIAANYRATPKTLEHGDYEYLFKFNTLEDVDKWKVNTDRGFQVGKSKARFYLTDQNTGHFCGYTTEKLDKPELTKALYSGYVNIQSMTQYMSFGRLKNFIFEGYTHFLMKIRGDGRTYVMVLNTPYIYVQTKTYVYTTPIYTRGGPHWQYIKVPFSKFLHGSHGRISDKQYRFLPTTVQNIGFTLMDHNEGPFSLEIDSIAVVKDNVAYEEFAYEVYDVPKYIANT